MVLINQSIFMLIMVSYLNRKTLIIFSGETDHLVRVKYFKIAHPYVFDHRLELYQWCTICVFNRQLSELSLG